MNPERNKSSLQAAKQNSMGAHSHAGVNLSAFFTSTVYTLNSAFIMDCWHFGHLERVQQ